MHKYGICTTIYSCGVQGKWRVDLGWQFNGTVLLHKPVCVVGDLEIKRVALGSTLIIWPTKYKC